MTRPTKLEHLNDCAAWWAGAARTGREEGERAWKVGADEIKTRGYNLDIRNPHATEAELGNPEALQKELEAAEAEVASAREQLKTALAEALLR